MHGQTVSAEFSPTNRFGTKNSYNASLELWADQPSDVEDDTKACCQPIQVINECSASNSL